MTDLAEKLEFSVSQTWQKAQKENPWLACILETATDSNGQEFIRRKGSKIAYRSNGEGYVCAQCGSEILTGSVAHAIWRGFLPTSNTGKCHHEEVPYCPKCEKEPDFHGTPIQHA